MATSVHKRTSAFWFLSVVLASAITMVWLFWRYPRTTGIATIVVLAGFYISARLSRLIDADGRSELNHGKPRH